MKPPIEDMKHRPYGEDFMTGAWIAFFKYSFENKNITDAFKKETGHDVLSVAYARGLTRMIDEKTGYQKEVITKFADFITLNLWGVEV